MRNSFLSSGDLGDIVLSLPAVKAAGGGTYYFVDRPWTKNLTQRAHLITPLLEAQPYIDEVVVGEPPDDVKADERFHDFSTFRFNGHPYGIRLALLHSRHVGIEIDEVFDVPWLIAPEPDTSYKDTVVFARSHRYRNPCFPWREIVNAYRGCSVFIGTELEHSDFEANFGKTPYVKTPTLLDAANILAGCFMFVGNQSSPNTVADGLCIPKVLEVCLFQPDCLYPKDNAWFCYGQSLELPRPKGGTIITREWAPPAEIDRTLTPPGGWQFVTPYGATIKHFSFNTCVRAIVQAVSGMSNQTAAEQLIDQTVTRLPGYGASAGWVREIHCQWKKVKGFLDIYSSIKPKNKKPTTMTLETTITLNGDEIPVEIEFSFHPGEPEVRYYKNGDGHPGCPECVEVESVKNTTTGEEIDVYSIFERREIESLENKCLAAATEEDAP
jgi:hypothetical protein